MRTILIGIYLLLYLILGLPLLGLEWVISKFNRPHADLSRLRMVQWGFKCISAIAGVKKNQAVLYIGNHRSYFDIVLTCPIFPGVTGYVAKQEMLKWPLLNLWMKYIHCLFLDRKDIRQGLKTVLKGVEEVKNGISLCIFPEGTRNKVNDTFLPFREGSFKIAEKGGVPVIPMVIVNSADVFEDHLPKVRKATVVIEFQPPIHIGGLDKETRKNLGGYVSGLISDRYFELKREYF